MTPMEWKQYMLRCKRDRVRDGVEDHSDGRVPTRNQSSVFIISLWTRR